jgi:hypothetical protein
MREFHKAHISERGICERVGCTSNIPKTPEIFIYKLTAYMECIQKTLSTPQKIHFSKKLSPKNPFLQEALSKKFILTPKNHSTP